ncbi:condensation domain-containing protein [Streptomyces olindensis]|uniref:condensation domain-containing protein n=1 Tax=Streptomyces olindensis TaxID=358823 RepID=UPI0036BEAA66
MDKITIRFQGKRDAIAPLTWAQQRTWRGSRLKYRTFAYVQAVPSGRSVQEVCNAARWAYEEYESLRTVFPAGADGSPYQRVVKVGSIDVVTISTEEPASAADLDSVIGRFREERFDVATELGALFAIVKCADTPTHLICLLSHLAVDDHGRRALGAALDSYFTGGRDRSSTPLMQPVDRARLERSTKWQDRSSRSLEYWKSVLERLPREGGRSAVMDSCALRAAVSVISEKLSTSTSAVYLAALSVAAGALIGRGTSSFLLPASNRFNPEERAFVGELVQFAPGVLESLDMPFEAVVKDAWNASLKGYRSSRYDEQALQMMISDLDEGEECKRAFDFSFNDMRDFPEGEAPGGRIEKLNDLARLTKIELRDHVYQGGSRFLSFALRGDGNEILSISVHDSYFPEFPVRRILQTIEALVVGVAKGDEEPLNHPLRFTKDHLEFRNGMVN